jgi:hypothetical protein
MRLFSKTIARFSGCVIESVATIVVVLVRGWSCGRPPLPQPRRTRADECYEASIMIVPCSSSTERYYCRFVIT